tara:strand:+ start:50 stop:253 length:204 start_codon:yes stop_codon:yes gene_type:complete
MNSYKFTVDFEVSVMSRSSESAMAFINSKYFIKDKEVCNFVNIPVDNVRIYPTSQTMEFMRDNGEEW